MSCLPIYNHILHTIIHILHIYIYMYTCTYDKRIYIYIYIGIDKVSHRLLQGYIDLVSVYKPLSSCYLNQPSTNRSRWGVGTYRYMAPEVVRYEQYTVPGHVGGWHQHLGCSIHGTPKMYGLYWKILLKWMVYGYPHWSTRAGIMGCDDQPMFGQVWWCLIHVQKNMYLCV